MILDRLTRDLFTEICRIPLIDPHSHIDPARPTARNLDDILGYHYYTELAHSIGMDQGPLRKDIEPRERVRNILAHLDRMDNTAQYGWFLEIARVFLGHGKDRVNVDDTDALWEAAERNFSQLDWGAQVFRRSNLEKIFLTNDFDDPLDGFDAAKYVPCLRTDDLVFHLDKREVRQRLAQAAGTEVFGADSMDDAVGRLFERFKARGAKACAISLPPDFAPHPVARDEYDRAILHLAQHGNDASAKQAASAGIFWSLGEHCRLFHVPFDLMIGVNRKVYRGGVHQGQDLFDQRTSLLQYAELFNAFPDVTFCVSVLSSSQNPELVGYSWIFPNVITSGHWWYANVPALIAHDCRTRLQAVPKSKQLGYYSDAYKLEFVLPKYNMYRSILARILADDFVRPGIYTETRAIELARLLLRENAVRIFHL